MALIIAFERFLNCTFTEADWPGARVTMPGTVTYDHPPKLLVAFVSVTPAVSESKTIWNGPVIVLPLIFVIVTVPLKV